MLYNYTLYNNYGTLLLHLHYIVLFGRICKLSQVVMWPLMEEKAIFYDANPPVHSVYNSTGLWAFSEFQSFNFEVVRPLKKSLRPAQVCLKIYSRNIQRKKGISPCECGFLTESSQAEFSSARHSFFFCGTLIDVLFFVQQNLGKDRWCLLLLCVLGQLLRAPKDNKEWGAQSPEAVNLEQLCATHPCRLGLSFFNQSTTKKPWSVVASSTIQIHKENLFSMAPAPRMAWPKGTQVMYHSWGSKASLASLLQVHQGIYWPWLIQTNADNNHSVTNNW